MREIVKLEVNKPVELALQFATGKIVDGRFGSQTMYSLAGNRIMYLDLGPAQQVNALALQPGETFFVCKRAPREYDCWLSPATEKRRAHTDPPFDRPTSTPAESELERQLADSLAVQAARKHAASAAAPPPQRGTGTYGPVAAPAPLSMPVRASWTEQLLISANSLVDVFAAALAHSSQVHGNAVKPEDVRAIVLSAYISASKGQANG